MDCKNITSTENQLIENFLSKHQSALFNTASDCFSILTKLQNSDIELIGSTLSEDQLAEAKKLFKIVKDVEFCRPYIGKSLTITHFVSAALFHHFFNQFKTLVPQGEKDHQKLAALIKKFGFCMTRPEILTSFELFKDDERIEHLKNLLKDFGKVQISDICDSGLDANAVLSNLMQLQLNIERFIVPELENLEKKITDAGLNSKDLNPKVETLVNRFSYQEYITPLHKKQREGVSQLLLISKYLRKRLHLSMNHISDQSVTKGLDKMHITEFMKQMSRLFSKVQQSEDLLLSLNNQCEYFFALVFPWGINHYSKSTKEFFRKEYKIILDHQSLLIKKIFEEAAPFWDPASTCDYIELIKCINSNIFEYLESPNRNVKNKNHKNIINKLKREKQKIIEGYITHINKYFTEIHFFNKDDEILRELFECFLNLNLSEYTEKIEFLISDVVNIVKGEENLQISKERSIDSCFSFLSSHENDGSYIGELKKQIRSDKHLTQYIKGRQNLKLRYIKCLLNPKMIELKEYFGRKYKISNQLLEGYFLILKSAYGDFLNPIFSSLINGLEINRQHDWEMKYRNLSWADEIPLSKTNIRSTHVQKKRRRRRKKQVSPVTPVQVTESPTPMQKTVGKVQEQVKSFIEQVHCKVLGTSFQNPAKASYCLHSQIEALRADQLYVLDHLDLMVSLIKKGCEKGFQSHLKMIVPQLINTCYLLEELSTTPIYLQRYPREAMTHGLVRMNEAIGRQVGNDLDKGTLWYRYPYGSSSIYGTGAKPKGLQMILEKAADTQEMLNLCQDAIRYMVDRLPHDEHLQNLMEKYLEEFSQIIVNQPVSFSESKDVQAITKLETKMKDRRNRPSDFIYHLGQLKTALQLIDLFPENQYLSLHLRNLTYAGQYLVETAGVYLSQLNGEEVRTHNLKVYIYTLKQLGLQNALSSQSLSLINRINTKKGVDYPNLIFWAKPQNKIPKIMHLLSKAYQTSWTAHSQGEDFQPVSKKGQFTLTQVQALAKEEVKLAKELVDKLLTIACVI